MARTQATTYTSIWSDPEFCALTKDAQRLYWLLLSQPKLTLCGSLDSHPARWSKLAVDDSPAQVISSLAQLEVAGFVVADEDELVLRTFVRHDLGRGTVNRNLVKGMWSAWGALVSPLLRKVVVDNVPDSVWQATGAPAPGTALELRSEPRLELPLHPWSEPSVDLLSDPCSLLTAPSPSPQTTPKVEPAPSPVDVEQQVRKAVGIYSRTIAARHPEAADPGAYAYGVGQKLTDEDRALLTEWITGGDTAEDAAARLADPLRNIDGPGRPAADPAAKAAADDLAKRRERATADRLASQRAEVPAPPPADLKASLRRPTTTEASA